MITALRQRLLSDATILGIVGAKGVYRWPAPKTAPYPFITYQKISLSEERNLSGTQPAWSRQGWQIDAYTTKALDAYDLMEAVRDRLRTTGPEEWDDPRDPGKTFSVHFVNLISGADGFDPIDNAQADAGTARETLTYEIKANRKSA